MRSRTRKLQRHSYRALGHGKKTRCEMKKDEIGGAYSMHDRLAKTIIFKYETPKERDHLEDLSADRRIIL